MIVEVGHYALVLALALALVQSVIPIWGTRVGDPRLMAVAGPAAWGQFLFVSIAFAALTWAHVVSDFSVANVFENSHSQKPMIYKISGVWGNHEGSMLLWVSILALFGAMVAWFGRNLPRSLYAAVLGVQAWVATAFYLFVLLTSNPFARLLRAPMEGRDLNPILQDPGLAIHPPLLYLGYVGFSIAFSFAVAALIEGRIDAAWARWVRPWTLAAWVFLTLGIAMGSYWAYYELGWGGWWFWDPVENASLMPWLAGTALLHSAIVMEKRDALKVWTILLAILTFSLSLLGTFLVRSGVLTSVHAFATDPARGVFILGILVVFVGGSLTIFAARAGTLTKGGLFAPISREGALVFNNLFLTAATASVFIGTLYPLLLEATTGGKISVGAPFFEMTFGPLMVPLLLAVPIGPFLAWKRGDLLAVAQRLAVVFALAIAATLVTWWVTRGGPVLAPLGVGLAMWLVFGALAELAFRIKLFSEPGVALRRAVGLPRSAWGTTLGHLGVGLLLFGIVAESAWKTEHVLVMKPGDTLQVARFDLTLLDQREVSGPNYDATVARFVVKEKGREVAMLEPAKRNYRTRRMPTTETAIATFDGFSQLYLAMGEPQGGGVAMRIYWKPMVLLIWLGCLVMAIGGTISLTDRRLRIGAPMRARPPPPPPPPAGGARRRRTARRRRRVREDAMSRSSLRRLALAAALLAPFAGADVARAVQPDEMLADPKLETRARAISSELRCLVCQNQSIDDSDAPLAKDLRILVRERLQAGDDDKAVKDWLVARYGEFVLLRPRFEAQTLILWLAPFVVLGLGGLAAWRTLRRRGARPAVEAPLTAEEKARLAELLADEPVEKS